MKLYLLFNEMNLGKRLFAEAGFLDVRFMIVSEGNAQSSWHSIWCMHMHSLQTHACEGFLSIVDFCKLAINLEGKWGHFAETQIIWIWNITSGSWACSSKLAKNDRKGLEAIQPCYLSQFFSALLNKKTFDQNRNLTSKSSR